MYLRVASILLLVFAGGSAAGADHEPGEAILAAASAHLETAARAHHPARFDVEIEPGRLDPRLRLRRCDDGMEAFLAPGGRLAGNTTVGVRCLGPVQWSLYVPLRVRVEGEIVVLADAQPRGTVLARQQLRLERHDVGTLTSGYFTALDQPLSMVLRRALQGGTVLTPQMVEPRRLVQRGRSVILVVDNGSVAVRVEGEALGDGAHGDTVRVRNRSSSRVVEGVVSSEGTVRVGM